MDQQRGRPVLVEFWDFCRPNSLRTLPYLKSWHERYSGLGLRVIGVHSAGFEASEDPAAVGDAVERLGIEYPVVVDIDHQIWQEYENVGWPARYLFSADQFLFEYHFGEGGYAETERAIQELLGIERDTLAPIRPEDQPGAVLSIQSEDVAGPYSGPYEAGGVWAVFDGTGVATVNGQAVEVPHAGAYELITHERHTEGVIDIAVSDELRVIAVCFTPGLAGPGVT
jgi:hypothetical protein